jgi:hypothetical protein
MNRGNREITKENEAWGRRILTFQGALNAKEKWERLEGPGNVRVARGEEGRWKKSGGLASPSPAAWPWRSLSERCVWREKRREAEAGGENMLCPATAHGAAAPPPSSCRPPGWLVRRRWFCAVLAKNWRRQERTTRAWRPSSDYWNSFRKRRPFPVDFVGLLLVKED